MIPIIGTEEAVMAAKVRDMLDGKVCVPRDIAEMRHRLQTAKAVQSKESKTPRRIAAAIRELESNYSKRLLHWVATPQQ